jgi:hypothetical protein
MFSTTTVLADLADLGAGVSLALPDLSPKRAAAVRRFNEAGVPVTAWLVMPKAQGYFFNAGNVAAAARRFEEFAAWSVEYGLRWAAVGLDIEPDFDELRTLAHGRVLRLFSVLTARSLDYRRILRARTAYQDLISRIRSSGYRVEVYQLFFMADERRARSTLLERLLGVVDVTAERNCLMLYTSFHHSWSASVIQVYGADAGCIVVGSTGGDSPLDSGFAPLSWDELLRDLRAARQWTNEIGVYSLEGCVRQGMLSRLKDVDWRVEPAPGPTAWQPGAIRRGLSFVFLADRYGYAVAAILVALLALWTRRLPRTIGVYFLLTYSISWAGALAVTARYWTHGDAVPKMAGLLMFPAMLLGPCIIGILLTFRAAGAAGVRNLVSSMFRIGSPKWLSVIALPPALMLAVLLGLKTFVSPVFAPNHFWIGILFGVAAGFIEEIGWTGFALPMMLPALSVLRAGILLGLLWSLWHLPVIDFLGSATPHGAHLILFFLAFVAAMTALRVLISWVYSSTASLLLAQMLHASSTAALAMFGPSQVDARQEAAWYALYALALWTAVAVLTNRVGPALTDMQPETRLA